MSFFLFWLNDRSTPESSQTAGDANDPSETSEPHFEPRATRLRRLLREDLVRIDPGRAPSRSSFQRQLGAGRFPIAVALPFDPVALWLLTLPKVPPLVLPSPRLSVAVRLLA